MGIVALSELRPGMVLADDATTSSGRFLLARGTRLTLKHLEIFKTRGVIEANVEGVTDHSGEKAPEELDPSILLVAENAIRESFSICNLDHPATRKLFRICTLRKARQLIAGEEKPVVQHLPAPEDDAELEQLAKNQPSRVDPLELIKREVRLSTLPVILVQINEVLADPNSSAIDIGRVISRDTSLSLRLLTIVNSAFYGFPAKIDSLSRAVLVIGLKELSMLAMGLKILDIFKGIPCELVDMKSFLKHSICCGVSARILAGFANNRNIERLFVSGLLHDVGRLILYNQMPLEARTALLIARYGKSSLYEVENETMGCNHATIGGSLIENWKLPPVVQNIVRYHHIPQESKDPFEPAIMHVADFITNALGIGSSGQRLVPPLGSSAWQCTGLSENMLPQVVDETDRQCETVLRFLSSETTPDPTRQKAYRNRKTL